MSSVEPLPNRKRLLDSDVDDEKEPLNLNDSDRDFRDTNNEKRASLSRVQKVLDFSTIPGPNNSKGGFKINQPKRKRREVVWEDDENGIFPNVFIEEISDDDEQPTDRDEFSPENQTSHQQKNRLGASNQCTGTPSASSSDPRTPSTCNSLSSTSSGKRQYGPRSNTRRRLKTESEKMKRKKAFGAGLEYTTSTGKVKKGRKIGPGCHQSCRKCKARPSEEARKKCFSEFWSLNGNERKWDYLSRRVKSFEPKTRNTLPERAKKSIKVYTLHVEGTEVKVCKTMFLDTLNINHSWVETALRKVEKKGNITPEKRGHGNRPNITTDQQKETVRRHLATIERVPSHYCRSDSKREYFESGLNFERLYKMYVEWAKTVEIKTEDIATESMYHEIFMNEYNIGFHKPKKDLCLVCSQWKIAKDDEKRDMLPAYNAHLEWKNFIKKTKNKEKDEATSNEKLCVACFDLEKVLTCPRSEISIMYYLTKLSVYNFTVMELHSKRGFCYLWSEITANRCANEIASNLMSFITLMVSKGKTLFRLFSDAPSGQNRNRMVFALWLFVASKFGIDITHRFFESGHSCSEVDNMHSRVETEAKGKEIFHPDQWKELILKVKQNGEEYDIEDMTQEKCYDFHDLVDKLQWKRDTDGNKVMWSTVKQVRVDHNTPDTIFFKYGNEEEKKIIVNPGKNGFDLSSYEFKRAYNGPIPLRPKKVKDLKSILDKQVVPHQYRPFYQRLIGENGG